MTNFLMGNKILLIQKFQMDNGQAILKCRVYKSKPDILNFSQSVAIILFLFSNKEIQGTGYPALVGDPPIRAIYYQKCQVPFIFILVPNKRIVKIFVSVFRTP